MKRRVNITLNHAEITLLESLLSKGLYGRSLPEIIRRLIDRQLEQLIVQKQSHR